MYPGAYVLRSFELYGFLSQQYKICIMKWHILWYSYDSDVNEWPEGPAQLA